MPYAPFYELFPEIAERETRAVIVPPASPIRLPPAEYCFIEMFCNEEDCDCRRAFFMVQSLPERNTEALISWGWESAAFYKKWLGFGDSKMIEEMQGPILDMGSPVTKNAKVLLEIFTGVVLADPKYVERVKTHYAMFRTAIDARNKPRTSRPEKASAAAWGLDLASSTQTAKQPAFQQRVGRNDRCPCGSGKKFKSCCLK